MWDLLELSKYVPVVVDASFQCPGKQAIQSSEQHSLNSINLILARLALLLNQHISYR